MEITKIVSSMQLYSQLDKHVSRLAASAIIDDRSCRSGREQEIEDGLAASKVPNESRPRRLRRLMCLVLPPQGSNYRIDLSRGLRLQVTGQLADTPTRGLPTRGLDNSRSRRCRQKNEN